MINPPTYYCPECQRRVPLTEPCQHIEIEPGVLDQIRALAATGELANREPPNESADRRGSAIRLPEPRAVFGGLLAPDDPPLSNMQIKSLRLHVGSGSHFSHFEIARVLDALDIANAEIALPKGSDRGGDASVATLEALTMRVEALEHGGIRRPAFTFRPEWPPFDGFPPDNETLPRPTAADVDRWKKAARETPGPLGRCIRILLAEVERLASDNEQGKG